LALNGVAVVMADPALDSFAFFLAAERREVVEKVVGVEQRIEAPLAQRAGVEDPVALPK
jgi:hypothetical protein